MNASQSVCVGELLRQWRHRRRLSQLDLAVRAEISARHLSFVETGRSHPSRGMILRLSEHLDVPLRDRNHLLLAGGYAPAYANRDLTSQPLGAIRAAVRDLLDAHQPYPALVVDRSWTLIDANPGLQLFADGCAADLLQPPINVLRLSLHPAGMAPRITNLPQWRTRLLSALSRQASLTADPDLHALHRELSDYPGGSAPLRDTDAVVVPLRYRYQNIDLSLLSTAATFAAPLDITVAELTIESFFPADQHTREQLHTLTPRSTDSPAPIDTLPL